MQHDSNLATRHIKAKIKTYSWPTQIKDKKGSIMQSQVTTKPWINHL